MSNSNYTHVELCSIQINVKFSLCVTCVLGIIVCHSLSRLFISLLHGAFLTGSLITLISVEPRSMLSIIL